MTTELSPDAQAILDAAVGGAHPAFVPIARPMTVVILRAVAKRLSYGHGSWAGKSAIIDEDVLLGIANELEGGTNG